MAVADVVAPLSDLDYRTQLRRAVIASTVGTTIEWYDFLLYGQMAAIVFAKLYFPSSDLLTGTLQSFAVFAVGFAARPIGAAIFGHYGDRIGRKAALIATLLLTGLSTFLVGCVPTYEQIGIWGAVLLVALRFIQGIGHGGEWGGSVLLSMEWARTSKNHGVIAAWPQFGVLTAFARMGQMAPFFVYSAFVFTYGQQVVHLSRDLILLALLIGSFMSFFTIPLWGFLSDRLGRRRVYICGAIATGLFAFAYFPMFNTAIPALIILATMLAFFFHDMMWGPLAALTAEVFTPRLRYSGASIGFQLSSVFAGGPAPMIATALLAATASGYIIALYIFCCAMVSVVATAMLPSMRDLDFAREHA
jgi:MFS family permease